MNKSELTAETLYRFIELGKKHNKQYSKKFIATVLYNENPDVYTSIEDARRFIRIILYDKEIKKYNDLRSKMLLLPESINELENVEPFVMPTSANNTLWIADTHGRFYNKQALEMALNYGVKQKCNSVVILGDFVDNYDGSKFDKDPSIERIWEEREWGQDMLELLQNTFGYVVYKLGNHDLRRELYIQRICKTKPELIDEISTYEQYMYFEGSGVQFVKDYNHIIYGKLNAIHGHEYDGSGGINVARNRALKAYDNLLSAHSHITGSYPLTDINGNLFMSNTIGCLCNLHPRYKPKNQYNHGFAHTLRDADGFFELRNKMISNGKIF